MRVDFCSTPRSERGSTDSISISSMCSGDIFEDVSVTQEDGCMDEEFFEKSYESCSGSVLIIVFIQSRQN